MRCKNILKQDRGVAGLTVFLSLIVMLFITGLLIMIFSLMGGELKDSSSIGASETVTGVNDTSIAVNNATGSFTLTACDGDNQGAITVLQSIYNSSDDVITIANFTTSGCIVTATNNTEYNTSIFDGANVLYTYTYAGEGWNVINETIAGIGGAVDWFDIFIVIGAMVVLILLTVMIIIAIRGSGLIVGTEGSGGNFGSA